MRQCTAEQCTPALNRWSHVLRFWSFQSLGEGLMRFGPSTHYLRGSCSLCLGPSLGRTNNRLGDPGIDPDIPRQAWPVKSLIAGKKGEWNDACSHCSSDQQG
jgi:hypothetical protein